jgi:hypothetical protein
MRKPTTTKVRLPRRFLNRDARSLLRLTDAQRDEVIRRHARTRADGQPVVCIPSLDEQQGFKPRKETTRADRAPIFSSETTAAACAQELLLRFGGRELQPYRCGRSKAGHWHLA